MSKAKQEPTRALVLCPVSPQSDPDSIPEYRLEEAEGLAMALDIVAVRGEIIQVRRISPATFISGAVIDRFRQTCETDDIQVLVFDGALTPVQQRNLETRLQVKVLDRTGLILEIFSIRARTREGRVQVELARITYERSRLVRTWTHLERQRGGRGFLAGPGERQIESDRRMLSDRATVLRRKLGEIHKTRKLHRQSRKRHRLPVIALVGYTNAGKSTLFNKLTGADILARDMLFATLDPTMRQITLPVAGDALLSDTVGFISNLPTELVAAFRATLEEVTEADLILHVRDISHEQTELHAQKVQEILDALLKDCAERPQIMEVFNKADLLDHETRQWREYKTGLKSGPETAALISAKTGEGLEQLLESIASLLYGEVETQQIFLLPHQLAQLDWFRKHSDVRDCESDEQHTGAMSCTIRIRHRLLHRFQARNKCKFA